MLLFAGVMVKSYDECSLNWSHFKVLYHISECSEQLLELSQH